METFMWLNITEQDCLSNRECADISVSGNLQIVIRNGEKAKIHLRRAVSFRRTACAL